MSDLISRSEYRSKLVKALDVFNKKYREALLNEDHDLILAIQNQQSAYMIALRLLDYEDLEEQGRLIKLPVKDGATVHRECVHIKSTCYHENYKCSECPLTELFCDEFYKAIDRCYEEAYASGCLAGMDLAKRRSRAEVKGNGE